jgi:hypothetical protein
MQSPGLRSGGHPFCRRATPGATTRYRGHILTTAWVAGICPSVPVGPKGGVAKKALKSSGRSGRMVFVELRTSLTKGEGEMTPENFERVLRAFQRRTPFRPFTVQFVSGERVSVDHPEALVSRAGVAVYISSEGIPTLFDHESVSEVVGDRKQSSP